MNTNHYLPPDAIVRDPSHFSTKRYDLIVVGGGIYGVMLALEAARRDLAALLVEKDDFGTHTSYNHLRILHGGLRYLQTLDFRRFRDSVRERSWFFRTFPNLARPLDCLLPLYGDGLRRPMVFRVALALDSLMGKDRNIGLGLRHQLKKGEVLAPRQTMELFPCVNSLGLQGAAFWHDGFVPDSPRLVIELIRWSCSYGIRALNYCQVEELITKGDQVKGVRVRDRIDYKRYAFHAPLVINCAGPWSREIAGAWDRDLPALFPERVLSWNLFFNRSPLSSCAVAVSPPRKLSHTYFILPWQGKVLIGTGQTPLSAGEHRPPRLSEVDAMINDINEAVPGLELSKKDLIRIFWGVVPAQPSGRLSRRPIIIDHGSCGRVAGFYSISGVKFTTARRVADRTLRRIFPKHRPRPYCADFGPSPLHGRRGLGLMPNQMAEWETLAKEESATSLSDLVLRRSDLMDREPFLKEGLHDLASLFPEDDGLQIQGLATTLSAGIPPEIGANINCCE